MVLSASLHFRRYHNLLTPAPASPERLMKQAGPWSRKDKITTHFDMINKNFVTYYILYVGHSSWCLPRVNCKAKFLLLGIMQNCHEEKQFKNMINSLPIKTELCDVFKGISNPFCTILLCSIAFRNIICIEESSEDLTRNHIKKCC